MKRFRYTRLPIILAFSALEIFTQAIAQGTGTRWATMKATDSRGADVMPEGFTGRVDPLNAEQACKAWCLADARCTMFLYYTDDSGRCFIKTGSPANVVYQIHDPSVVWNLAIREMTCDTASGYVAPYVPAGRQPPVCFETTGNTEDGEDEVPQGALNEPCLPNNTCLNGNLCDLYEGGSGVCKSPMGGVCRDVSDCSYTISDPRLDCTLEGGTNDNRICAITEVEAEPEPPVPAPSQAAARRQRRMLKARMSASLSNVCPERTIGCPLSTGIGHECVNPDEELAHCGKCGNDCQELPGVHELGVACTRGECTIYRCQKGFKLVDGSCILKVRRKAQR